MFKKYIIPIYITAVVLFSLEFVMAIMFFVVDSSLWYILGFVIMAAISAAWGGWIQWIGAKYHSAESYIISCGFGFQVPFTQFLSIYFAWKFDRKR